MMEKLAQLGEGGGMHAYLLSLYLSQSKYRGKVEIAGVYICPPIWNVHFVRDGRYHRVHIFTRDETGLVCLPTQLERTLQLYC
jgi:hypothetical protein